MSTVLTIPYAGGAATEAAPWLNLEQVPVPTNRLSLADLETMLAMVGGGTPARVYSQPVCPAMVRQGEVAIDLGVRVWPSDPALAYRLSVDLGTLADPVRIEMEREFDLVLNFAASTDLPFHCRQLSWQWSALPCFDRFGREVARPRLTVTPAAIRSSGDFLGVIRVRCLAVGYLHALTMRLPKSEAATVTDVTNTATATWTAAGEQQDGAVELALPRCVEQLLALCPDGGLQQERYYGGGSDDPETRPVVYYNACNGSVITIRYERA